MIAMLPSLIGIGAANLIAGTSIPVQPDGVITFDGDEADATAVGNAFTFSATLDGDAIPLFL